MWPYCFDMGHENRTKSASFWRPWRWYKQREILPQWRGHCHRIWRCNCNDNLPLFWSLFYFMSQIGNKIFSADFLIWELIEKLLSTPKKVSSLESMLLTFQLVVIMILIHFSLPILFEIKLNRIFSWHIIHFS